MQRRGFLGLLGAAIAAPFVPTPAADKSVRGTFIADYGGVLTPTWSGVDLATKPDITCIIRFDGEPFEEAMRKVSAMLARESI